MCLSGYKMIVNMEMQQELVMKINTNYQYNISAWLKITSINEQLQPLNVRFCKK